MDIALILPESLHQELKTPLNIFFNNTLETEKLADGWEEAHIGPKCHI